MTTSPSDTKIGTRRLVTFTKRRKTEKGQTRVGETRKRINLTKDDEERKWVGVRVRVTFSANTTRARPAANHYKILQ